jgi:F-type H+-transporting ATPase subunit b
MDATFHELGRILLNAVPTFLLLLFLVPYLRWAFFKPLAGTLEQRYEATEGARKAAQDSMKRAEELLAEYEEKLRAARHEIYAEQDRIHRELEHQLHDKIVAARRDADALIGKAKQEIAIDAEAAKRQLDAESNRLAELIVERILQGSVA